MPPSLQVWIDALGPHFGAISAIAQDYAELHRLSWEGTDGEYSEAVTHYEEFMSGAASAARGEPEYPESRLLYPAIRRDGWLAYRRHLAKAD